MNESVVITVRPVSHYDLHDVKVVIPLHKGDFTRAARDAVRLVSKSYHKSIIVRFDIVSIEVV